MVSSLKVGLKSFHKWKYGWFLLNFRTRLPLPWNGFLSEVLNAWLVGFDEGLGHACSIDFGSHKLATMPPSKPSDNCLMVTKVLGLTPLLQTTLLKSQQHRGSSISRVWAVGLLLGSFSDWDGHGSWFCIMFFQSPCVLAVPNGPLSIYLEVCRMYSTEIHDFQWDRKLWWAGDVGAAWRGSRKKD